MDRRRFIGGLGAAFSVGLAGCGDRADPTTTHTTRPAETPTHTVDEWTYDPVTGTPPDPRTVADDHDFSTVVDVTDLGADPSGDRPLGDAFDAHDGDDTLFVLPEGRYRVDRSIVPELESVGIVGEGATIVPTEGFSDTLFGLGYPDPARKIVVDGLTFDYRAPATGGRPVLAMGDHITARDLTVLGEEDVNQDLFRFDVTSADGQGTVERIRLPDGAPANTKVTGIEVGDDNRGDIDFVDCYVDGFPDNGLYADAPAGRVRVEGGFYRNNGIAGVRVESDGGIVRNVHVRCDADVGGDNMRGIRLRAGANVLVENCLVELVDVTTSDGAIALSSELASATVRNCELRVDADDVNALRVKSSNSPTAREGPFVFENITVSGTAAGGAGVNVADRRNCTFRDVCIRGAGASRNGISADNVHGVVENAHISVTGRALAFENSTIQRRNVTVGRSNDGGTETC